MKPILVLQNSNASPPGYLITWLKKHNIDYVIYNSANGDQFPNSIDPYSGLAVMGGDQSANDPLDSNHRAEILILQAMYRDKPVIGHCLGGQLMAKALGGKITTSPKPEIGWQSIQWSDDPLVKYWFGSNPTPVVMHWHYETFSIPEGATLLGGNASCQHQAFSIGPHLAMQFHIEIDQPKIDVWLSEDDPKWQSARTNHVSAQSRETIISGIDTHLVLHQSTADWVYGRWIANTDLEV